MKTYGDDAARVNESYFKVGKKLGVSYSRNPFLVKYMENLRYIDQLGRGHTNDNKKHGEIRSSRTKIRRGWRRVCVDYI